LQWSRKLISEARKLRAGECECFGFAMELKSREKLEATELEVGVGTLAMVVGITEEREAGGVAEGVVEGGIELKGIVDKARRDLRAEGEQRGEGFGAVGAAEEGGELLGSR
jgi:hypothetical protein